MPAMKLNLTFMYAGEAGELRRTRSGAMNIRSDCSMNYYLPFSITLAFTLVALTHKLSLSPSPKKAQHEAVIRGAVLSYTDATHERML